MNVVGKILAFLNLVFAVVVAGLFTLFSITSTNWKTAYEGKVRDVQAMQSQLKTWQETATSEQTRNKNSKGKFKDIQETDIGIKVKYDLDIIELQRQLEEQRTLRFQGETARLEAVKTLDGRDKETKLLRNIIDQRSAEVLDLHKKNDVLKNEKEAALTQFKTMFDRVNTAMQDNKVLRQEIFDLRAKGSEGENKVVMKDDNYPSFKVDGMITALKGGGVQVNVGADEGIQKGHTLEVFRLEPKLEYLGKLRIDNAYAHDSVGRLVAVGGALKAIRVGDRVANSLELGR